VCPYAVLKLEHSILPSEYESVLADDDIMNVAVVIKDVLTKERFLAMQEFNVTSPKITVEVEYSSKLHPSQIHHAVFSLFLFLLQRSLLWYSVSCWLHMTRLIYVNEEHKPKCNQHMLLFLRQTTSKKLQFSLSTSAFIIGTFVKEQCFKGFYFLIDKLILPFRAEN